MAELTYTVTVASGNLYGGGTGNVFYLDGVRNSTGPGTVSWVKDATLRFDQSASSNNNHPLVFSTNTSTSGIISSGVTYYLDGASNQANYTNTTTFNAATTRYVEITPSSETDFFYLCYVHGIGMGGIFDITQDTWGANVWGSNSWASLINTASLSGQALSTTLATVEAFPEQGWGGKQWGVNEWGQVTDVTASPSGQALTFTIGTEEAEGILNRGWGRKNWGEEAWGIGGSVLPNGIQIATSLASVSVTNEINIGWGGLTWGSGDWGDLANPNIDVTGIALTASLGNEANTADANVSVTGIGRTITLAGAVGGTSVDISPTGSAVTTATANPFAGPLVTVQVTSPVNDEWGTETWGQGFWGVGDGVTVFVGTDTVHIGDANVQLTGVQSATSLGATVIPVIIESGVSSTFSMGTVFGGELVAVQVTTASATSWGDAPWGEGQWGQGEGTDIGIGGEEAIVPSIDVFPTGQVATFSIGTEAITGNANVTVSGQSLAISLGDEDAFTNVRINATGFSIGTIQIGDFLAGISDTATPTGVTMTPATGTIGLNAWEIVDPGTSPTWTVVDKAA